MQTRRTFIGRLCAAAAGLFLAPAMARGSRLTDGKPDRLTAMDADGARVGCVMWNGHQISCECFEFNRREGWAKCYVRKSVGGDVALWKVDQQCPLDELTGWEWRKLRVDNMTTTLRGEISYTWRDEPVDRSKIRRACMTVDGQIHLSEPGKDFVAHKHS